MGSAVAKYLVGSNASFNVLGAAKAGMSLILEDGLGAEKEYEADRLGNEIRCRLGLRSYGIRKLFVSYRSKARRFVQKCLRGSKNKRICER